MIYTDTTAVSTLNAKINKQKENFLMPPEGKINIIIKP